MPIKKRVCQWLDTVHRLLAITSNNACITTPQSLLPFDIYIYIYIYIYISIKISLSKLTSLLLVVDDSFKYYNSHSMLQ